MSKPPLWEVMHRAHNDIGDPFGSAVRAAYAAEIRALRDWLVPEEEPPLGPAGKQNMHLRSLLTAEADRAELGDQPTNLTH